MTNQSRDFEWMRAALDLLYDEFNADQARELLYNDAERKAALQSLRTFLAQGSLPLSIPPGDLGDNLFQALLAIRIKFAPDEGRQKVELNIAMRQRLR